MKETMMDYRITESYVVEARIVHMHTARARERVSGGRSNKYVPARAVRRSPVLSWLCVTAADVDM